MSETNVSDRQIATMLAGLNGVTPGPWFTTGAPWFRSEDGVLAGSPDGNLAYLIADCDDWMSPRDEYVEGGGPFKLGDKDADAAHIARCDPDTIRSILIELQSLRSAQAGEVEFTHVAKTKLDGLLNDGWQINGYSIEKNRRLGLVTTGAFVGWYTNAVENAEKDREAATALSAGVRVKGFADAKKRMQEALDLHDAEVADQLASEGERADLWTDIDVLVDDLRVILSALDLSPAEGGPVGIVGFDDVTDGLRVTLYAGAAVSEGDELYAAPSNPVISDEMMGALKRIRDASMLWTIKGQIPEAGVFGTIAQDADWLCDQIAALSVKPQSGSHKP